MKKTKPTYSKIVPISILAPVMCFSVVLSHVHAKDAVPLLAKAKHAPKFAGSDITAKALGDLHNHIDKAGVKNIHNDASTSARQREFQAVVYEGEDASLIEQVREFMLRLRVVASMMFRLT